jgi:hypothetical protein
MAGVPIYFGRRYRLSLHIPGQEPKVFEVQAGLPAMDIKFDVTYARGQTAREGTISILGLGYKTIHEFIALAGETRGYAMSRLIRVKLEAGYFTAAGMVEILNGFAWYATVTSPPQMWLNINVSEYNPLGARKVSLGITEPMTMRNILEKVASRFTEVENDGGESVAFAVVDKTQDLIVDNSQDLIGPIDFGGDVSLAEAIQILNQNLSDEVMVILRSRNIDKTRVIECLDKNKRKAARGEVRVDKDNGLLTVTGIDVVNGCVTTFLDGRWEDELSHLILQSELNKQANGRYYIIKKQYVGHFMGQEWYVRYSCSAREN